MYDTEPSKTKVNLQDLRCPSGHSRSGQFEPRSPSVSRTEHRFPKLAFLEVFRSFVWTGVIKLVSNWLVCCLFCSLVFVLSVHVWVGVHTYACEYEGQRSMAWTEKSSTLVGQCMPVILLSLPPQLLGWQPGPAFDTSVGSSNSVLHAWTTMLYHQDISFPKPSCLFFIIPNPISISHLDQCFRIGSG